MAEPDIWSQVDQLEDPIEFIVDGHKTGWTAQDHEIVEKALSIAGFNNPADRLTAELSVDTLGLLALKWPVAQIDAMTANIVTIFKRLKGGRGR